MAKTLVIGPGSPFLGDDGVGWKVAQTVMERLSAEPRFRLPVRPIGSKSILKTAESIGTDTSKRVDLVAVEGQMVYACGEELSPPVAAAVVEAVQAVFDLLQGAPHDLS